MTGIDCLRGELEQRGLTKSQIDSKVAAVVLDVVAGSGDKYSSMWKAEENESERLKMLRRETRTAESRLEFTRRRLAGYEQDEKEALERREHLEDYIETFQKTLVECNSESGRDAMRAAQMFVNTVTVETKYDNTAYIIGLAAILSQGKINAISELKKINKKLPGEHSLGRV